MNINNNPSNPHNRTLNPNPNPNPNPHSPTPRASKHRGPRVETEVSLYYSRNVGTLAHPALAVVKWFGLENAPRSCSCCHIWKVDHSMWRRLVVVKNKRATSFGGGGGRRCLGEGGGSSGRGKAKGGMGGRGNGLGMGWGALEFI